MSDHIPEEVMANILLRLSVNDLVRCRRVSKQWLSIIDDTHFISLQLQRSISTNSNAALYLQDRKSPILFWKRRYASDINFFSTPIHYEPSEVLLMGSCHGLVCFSLFNHPHDFVVHNPSTGEWHTISISTNEERVGGKMIAYGFVYDELSEDYKVVRIIHTKDDSYSSYLAEINGVRSKGFSKTIPLPADWDDSSCKSIGVFVGGSIHWCKLHKINPNPYEHVIHAIDLLSNTYHQLQFPDYNFGQTGLNFLNVGIVNTCLSLCGVLKKVQKIGIWVMEEYGNPESWNRLYCIDYEDFCYGVTSVGSNGDKILLMVDWDRFAWCDPIKDADDETIMAVDAYWWYGRYEAMYCLESLVKIFPNQSADVKKDAYEKQLKKKLADQEILQNVPSFLDLSNLTALMYEDYFEDDDYYVDNDFSDSD